MPVRQTQAAGRKSIAGLKLVGTDDAVPEIKGFGYLTGTLRAQAPVLGWDAGPHHARTHSRVHGRSWLASHLAGQDNNSCTQTVIRMNTGDA